VHEQERTSATSCGFPASMTEAKTRHMEKTGAAKPMSTTSAA
jgi:hypothetical protein